jgi:hypothetical protein
MDQNRFGLGIDRIAAHGRDHRGSACWRCSVDGIALTPQRTAPALAAFHSSPEPGHGRFA